MSLFAGSVAVRQPTDASAARYTCEQAYALGDIWFNYAVMMRALGNPIDAAMAASKARVYYEYC